MRSGYLTPGFLLHDASIISPEQTLAPELKPAEAKEAASESSASKTKVYRVVVETDGLKKAMIVIDPSGNGPEAFQKSCRGRFGADRVMMIEERK